MSKPESADGGVWWAVGQYTRTKLHTDKECPALQRASKYEPIDLAKHPNPEWCQRCTGGGVTKGGGSREIYEMAKQIGQKSAEVQDDT